MRGGTLVVKATMGEEPAAPGRPVSRWWDLQLECTHTVRRPVRYKPLPIGPSGRRPRWGNRNRDAGDILPAQEHAYCPQCPTGPAVHDTTRIRVRASPTRAAAFVAMLRTAVPDLVVEGPRWRAGGFVDYYCETNSNPEGSTDGGNR